MLGNESALSNDSVVRSSLALRALLWYKLSYRTYVSQVMILKSKKGSTNCLYFSFPIYFIDNFFYRRSRIYFGKESGSKSAFLCVAPCISLHDLSISICGKRDTYPNFHITCKGCGKNEPLREASCHLGLCKIIRTHLDRKYASLKVQQVLWIGLV